MASQSTTPSEPAEAPAETSPAPDAKSWVGEYVDLVSRIYQFPDGPQTAELGDACALPAGFDDGRWQKSTRKPTRLRDNHPDEQAKTAARQTKARNQLHERLAGAQEGEQR